jgi:hypothetical protein
VTPSAPSELRCVSYRLTAARGFSLLASQFIEFLWLRLTNFCDEKVVCLQLAFYMPSPHCSWRHAPMEPHIHRVVHRTMDGVPGISLRSPSCTSRRLTSTQKTSNKYFKTSVHKLSELLRRKQLQFYLLLLPGSRTSNSRGSSSPWRLHGVARHLCLCILFIRTLSIVQFNKITTFQRLALSPSSGDKRERAKGR